MHASRFFSSRSIKQALLIGAAAAACAAPLLRRARRAGRRRGKPVRVMHSGEGRRSLRPGAARHAHEHDRAIT